MSNLPGGSAYAMVQQVADGYMIVTERSFKRLGPAELNQIDFEIEKVLRSIRGEQPDGEDLQAIQKRNRQIQRLTSCRMMLQNFRKRFRR